MPKTANPELTELTQQRDDARNRSALYTKLVDDDPDSPSVPRWRDKAARLETQAEQKQAQIDALASD